MGIDEANGQAPINHGPSNGAPHARVAVIADDRRQFEMDFGGQADLEVEGPSNKDITEVENALSDLNVLEGEIGGVSIAWV